MLFEQKYLTYWQGHKTYLNLHHLKSYKTSNGKGPESCTHSGYYTGLMTNEADCRQNRSYFFLPPSSRRVLGPTILYHGYQETSRGQETRAWRLHSHPSSARFTNVWGRYTTRLYRVVFNQAKTKTDTLISQTWTVVTFYSFVWRCNDLTWQNDACVWYV
jgi:hypothetical protein